MDKNHDIDFDKDGDRSDTLNTDSLKEVLEEALDQEYEMMKKYVMTAERIHDNHALKSRLMNFSEGNAKRSEQLEEELKNI